MYKILFRILLFIALPALAMEKNIKNELEEKSTIMEPEQADIEKLLELLEISETSLFYKALPIVKQYNEQEIAALHIEDELKNYAYKLKNEINKKLFSFLNIEKLKTLLNFGSDINTRDKYGNTPLSRASGNGKYKLVKLLLDQGANPNIPNLMGSTALIDAAKTTTLKSEEPESVKIVKLLIKNNADLNAVNANGNSALSFAAKNLSDGLVQLLLEHGANPNIANTAKHFTPLMLAARRNILATEVLEKQINIIKLLVKHHAKLFKRNYKGKTAFDIAKEKGNNEVADILKEEMIQRGKEIFTNN